MKPFSAFGWSLGIALLCGSKAVAQTNQQLLQDGLISPLVFELGSQAALIDNDMKILANPAAGHCEMANGTHRC